MAKVSPRPAGAPGGHGCGSGPRLPQAQKRVWPCGSALGTPGLTDGGWSAPLAPGTNPRPWRPGVGGQLPAPGSLFLCSPQISSSRGGQVGKLRHAQGVLVHAGVFVHWKVLAWRGSCAGPQSWGGRPGLRGTVADPQAQCPFGLESLLWAEVCLVLPVQGWRGHARQAISPRPRLCPCAPTEQRHLEPPRRPAPSCQRPPDLPPHAAFSCGYLGSRRPRWKPWGLVSLSRARDPWPEPRRAEPPTGAGPSQPLPSLVATFRGDFIKLFGGFLSEITEDSWLSLVLALSISVSSGVK